VSKAQMLYGHRMVHTMFVSSVIFSRFCGLGTLVLQTIDIWFGIVGKQVHIFLFIMCNSLANTHTDTN